MIENNNPSIESLEENRDENINKLNELPNLTGLNDLSDTSDNEIKSSLKKIKNVPEDMPSEVNLDLFHNSNAIEAFDLDDKKEAEAQQLEIENAIPFRLPPEEIKSYKEQGILEKINNLKQENKYLHNFIYSDTRTAVAVKDDIDSIREENSFFAFLKAFGTTFESGFKDANQLAVLEANWAMSKDLSLDAKQRINSLRQLQKDMVEAEKILGSYVSPLIHFAGMIAGMLPEAINSGLAGASAGMIFGSPLGIPGSIVGGLHGFSVGVSSSFAKQMFYQDMGRAYSAQIELGVDKDTAQVTSIIGGLASAVAGFFGMRLLASAIVTPLKNIVSRATSKALVRPTNWKLAKDFGVSTASLAVREVAINDIQEMIIIASEETGLALTENKKVRLSSPEGRVQLYDRMFQATTVGAKIFVPVGVLSSTLRIKANIVHLERTQTAFDIFETLQKMKLENKTISVNKEVKARVTNEMARGSIIENVFVPYDKLTEFFEEAGITEEEIEKNLPDVHKQMKEAEENLSDNGHYETTVENEDGTITKIIKDNTTTVMPDIVIKSGHFFEYFSALDEIESLKQHIRFSESGLSATEASSLEVEKLRRDYEQTLIDEKKHQEELEVVHKDIVKKLTRSKVYDESANHAFATLITAFVETQAFDLDMSVEELYRSIKPDIFAEEQGMLKRLRDRGVNFYEILGYYAPSQNMIVLNKNAGLRTFLHEAGHFFFEMSMLLNNFAISNEMPYKSENAILIYLEKFGLDSLEDYTRSSNDIKRKVHENFAYNFEDYLLLGKAPSPELQDVFRDFSRFVAKANKTTISAGNRFRNQMGYDKLPFDSPIKQLMDYLLASIEAVDTANSEYSFVPLFMNFSESGMSREVWNAYQLLIKEATGESVETLMKESMEQFGHLSGAIEKKLKKLQNKNKKLRAEIKEKVTKRVDNMRVYKAINFLKNGVLNGKMVDNHLKLNPLEVKEVLSQFAEINVDEVIKLLRKHKVLSTKDSNLYITIDQAKDLLGYTFSEELLTDIAYADTRAEHIKIQTDNQMMKEAKSKKTKEEIDALLNKALHNENRAKVLATELRWLDRLNRSERAYQSVAKEAAQKLLGKKKISEVDPSISLENESKFARLTNDAHKKGLTHDVIKYRLKQLLHHNVTNESLKVREQIKDFNDLVKKIFSADRTIADGNRDINRVNEARAVLTLFGLNTIVPIDEAMSYITNILKYDFENAERSDNLKIALENSKPFEELTVDQFLELNDIIRGLWQQATRERRVRIGGKLYLASAKASELTISLQKTNASDVDKNKLKGKPSLLNSFQIAKQKITNLLYSLTRAEHFIKFLDEHGTESGVFTRYLFREIKDATNEYNLQKKIYIEPIEKSFIALPKHKGAIDASILRHGEVFHDKSQLLAALLHAGNLVNLEKLLLGYGWGEYITIEIEPENKNIGDTINENQKEINEIRNRELASKLKDQRKKEKRKAEIEGREPKTIKKTTIKKKVLDVSRWENFIAESMHNGTITKADMDFVQLVWDQIDELNGQSQKAFYDMFGFYYKEVPSRAISTPFGEYKGGYVPLKEAKDAVQVVKEADNLKMLSHLLKVLETNFVRDLPSRLIKTGFTKDRNQSQYKVSLNLEDSVNHITDILKFTHLLPAIKDVIKILNDPEFRQHLDAAYPSAREQVIFPWLERTATQVLTEPGLNKTADTATNALRSNAMFFQLAGNVKNITQQITGLSVALGDLTKEEILSSIASFKNDGIEVFRIICEESPFMLERLNSEFRAMSDLFEQTMKDYVEQSKIGGVRSKIKKLSIDKHLLRLQHYTQSLVDMVVWHAKYNETLKRAIEPKTEEDRTYLANLSPDDLKKEAMQRADSLVRRTQDSYSAEDQARYQVGSPMWRAFTQYSSYSNSTANNTILKAMQIMRDVPQNERMALLTQTIFYTMILPTAIDKVVERMLYRGFQPTKDEDRKDIALDIAVYSQGERVLDSVPFVGSILKNLIKYLSPSYNSYGGEDFRNPSISQVMNAGKAVEDAIKRLDRSLHKEKYEGKKDRQVTRTTVKNYFTLISVLFGSDSGLPLGLMSRFVGFYAELANGNVEPTSFVDYMTGFVTGQAKDSTQVSKRLRKDKDYKVGEKGKQK